MLQSSGGQYLVWTRWGRVGIKGQSKMLGCPHPFPPPCGVCECYHLAAYHPLSAAAIRNRGNQWDVHLS